MNYHLAVATEEHLEIIIQVIARTTVAAEHYAEISDFEAEVQRLTPRVKGYYAGTYHPGYALADRAIFVAVVDGVIAGCVAGHRSTRLGCGGELQWMFVLPEYQRKGIGRSLLKPMAAWFVGNGIARVIIDAPPENPCRRFYLKYGAQALDEYWLYWPGISSLTDQKLA